MRHSLLCALVAPLFAVVMSCSASTRTAHRGVVDGPASTHTTDAGKAATPAPSTLLVANPTVSVLRSMRALMDRRALHAEQVQLVGIYHQAQESRFTDARAFLSECPDLPMRLQPIECAVSRENIFAPNPCTPAFSELVNESSGILFTGGLDISPSIYAEPTLLTTVIESPVRQAWEISFLVHLVGRSDAHRSEPLLAKRRDYVVLAVCLGMQSLNVATGGTLVQDIPSEIYGIATLEQGLLLPPANVHRSFAAALDPVPGRWPSVLHPIQLVPRGHSWTDLVSDAPSVVVLSAHHQAVEKLGQDLEVLALSLDGKVVEAVYHKRFPNVLGVQFHPEQHELWEGQVWPLDAESERFHSRLWRSIERRLAESASTWSSSLRATGDARSARQWERQPRADKDEQGQSRGDRKAVADRWSTAAGLGTRR